MTPLSLFVLDLSAEGAGRLTRHDPAEPVIPVTDLGVTRGDGIFETIAVRGGVLQALGPHLDRFERSAAMLDLPVPNRVHWTEAIEAAAAAIPEDPRPGAVKFVMTRGIEGGSHPTGWALGFLADDPSGERAGGIKVVTLDRGYRHDVAQTSPWLLQGAKSLAYAVNKAAGREAARRGADDVIFVSSDDYVLEGPSSTVIARFGDTAVTPPVELGILPGTTQADAFTALEAHGVATLIKNLSPADLVEADALWLCSSTRGAAPIRELDGAARTVDAAWTELMNTDLDARRR